jgi:hypothetical protein
VIKTHWREEEKNADMKHVYTDPGKPHKPTVIDRRGDTDDAEMIANDAYQQTAAAATIATYDEEFAATLATDDEEFAAATLAAYDEEFATATFATYNEEFATATLATYNEEFATATLATYDEEGGRRHHPGKGEPWGHN